jgi:nucleoside-diphosphate-sugar epimerase
MDPRLRILITGATGVLGRALLPHLAGHEIVAVARSKQKAGLLRSLGAEPIVCDVYDRGALRDVALAARPEVVVNFLTDLADGPGPQNDRIRRVAGPNVVAAAQDAGARRLVVESVSFALPGASGEAVAALERGALDSGLQALVLRFALLWGPGTWYAEPPDDPSVHVDEAGRCAAELLLGAATGVYEIGDAGVRRVLDTL